LGLADKLKTTTRSEPGLPCGVRVILDNLDGEDKEALELVFSSSSRSGAISNPQIHRILISEGYKVAFASVRLHRQQQCRCFIGLDKIKHQEMAEG
jgi:hypothetical protein